MYYSNNESSTCITLTMSIVDISIQQIIDDDGV